MMNDTFRRLLRLLLTVAILSCGPVAAAPTHAVQLTPADDLAALAAEARDRRVPILIVFTEATCPWCAKAKKEYLQPMQQDPAWRDRMLLREIDVRSTGTLRDFAGRPTTAREFSRSKRIRTVPTVMVFDDTGKPVIDPIIGLASEDFYKLYLEQAIEAGMMRMRYSGR